MLNNYLTNSRIHNMHPLSKIICFLIFLVLIFLANNLRLNVLILTLITLILLSTNISFSMYVKIIFLMKWFILLIFIISILFTSLPILWISKIIYIILSISILNLTTTFNELVYGLKIILFPFKILGFKINKLSFQIASLLKNVIVFLEQLEKTKKTQISRGKYHNFNILINRIKKQKNQLLEIKLYDINKKRTNFRQKRWKLYDTFLILVHLAVLLLVVKEVGL